MCNQSILMNIILLFCYYANAKKDANVELCWIRGDGWVEYNLMGRIGLGNEHRAPVKLCDTHGKNSCNNCTYYSNNNW